MCQNPILRKKGMNDMMLRDQFCAVEIKCRHIFYYNASGKEEVGEASPAGYLALKSTTYLRKEES